MSDKQRFRVLVQPHDGYFPVGTIVTYGPSEGEPADSGLVKPLRVYSDGIRELALFDNEVEPTVMPMTRAPEDVTIDASTSSVKATFTGEDSKIGAYAVGGVILLAALGFFVLPIIVQLFKG